LELLIEELQQIGTSEKLPDAFSSLGIQFHYYLDKQGTLSWTSLSGVGKRKMLCGLAIASLFPEDPSRGLRVQALWRSFYELYEIYSSIDYSFQGKTYSPAEYSQKATSWLVEFTAPSTGDPDQPTTDVECILIHLLPHTFNALSFIYHK